MSKKEGPGVHQKGTPNPPTSPSGSTESNVTSEPQHTSSHAYRSASPVPSHMSLKSEESMFEPANFSSDPSCHNQPHRSASPVPSHMSLKSEESMFEPANFSSDPSCHNKQQRSMSPVPSHMSLKSNESMFEPANFSSEAKSCLKPQKKQRPESLDCKPEPSKRFRSMSKGPEQAIESDDFRQSTDQTSPILSKVKDNNNVKEVSAENKANLKKRIENIHECVLTPSIQTRHKSIYIDLFITEGGSEGLIQEHEVLQVESGSKTQGTEDTAINCNDIFKPVSGQERPIRVVLTKGVACIGKTVLVQKFITDWADGKANQDIDFVFVLALPMLNRIQHSPYSLHKLLLDFHPELQNLKDSVKLEHYQVLFICFALDEGNLPLNFLQNQKVSDITEVSTVDTLITSLIQGSLLPSARIWIMSRPVASDQIPPMYINKVTEVRGFTDQQKEEYFRKRINNESQANKIIERIKTSRSLFIMCHLPVFCWIATTVLQQMLEEEISDRPPTTLTEMFMQFLLIQTNRSNQKYRASNSQESRRNVLESQKDIIMKLSHLAFTHLERGNYMFSEEELASCDLHFTNALVHSGLCTDVLKGESFHSGKMYAFVHVAIQEFLAALYVFVSYMNKNVETLEPLIKEKSRISLKDMSLDELLKSAVNRALESKSGHLDLFLRFLHGITLEPNQKLLQGLLIHTEGDSESISKAIHNLKALNRPNISPDRWINLLHCLVEMHDSSVQEEVKAYLKSEENAVKKLKLAHCSALANVLLLAKEPLDQLALNEYKTSDEGRRRLVPAVRNCRKALLYGCKLTEKCCQVVASALESAHSHLTELDLSNNNLQRSEERLFRALQSQHCKLVSLRLAGCKLTAASCEALASALQAEHSHLKELDLSSNRLEDSGVQHLASGLRSPHCPLQTLRMSGCNITGKGCEFLVFALEVKTCLAELHLTDNRLKNADVKRLSEIKEDPKSALNIFEYS